jgi:hypothetical protein
VTEGFADFGRPEGSGQQRLSLQCFPRARSRRVRRPPWDQRGQRYDVSVRRQLLGPRPGHARGRRRCQWTDLVLTTARDWNVDLSGAQLSSEVCPAGHPEGP